MKKISLVIPYSQMIPDNWYESFFTGINCEMWEKAGTPEMTRLEVDFLKNVLELEPGDRVLDIPCGTGRHSLLLAAEGYHLTAIDISTEFISGLMPRAAQLPITILHGDILKASLPGPFDAAFCIGNSFGYFVYHDMEQFVRKVSAQLKPGAKWVINSGLIAESFLARFITEKTFDLPGLTMHIHNDYDVRNSCLLTTLTYTKAGSQEVQQFKQHVYTTAELIRLLEKTGLFTTALYGNLAMEPYELGSQQLFLVCEKK